MPYVLCSGLLSVDYPQIPGHDDKVEQIALSALYDETAALWKVRLPA